MNYIFWYDGKRRAGSVTTHDIDVAIQIAESMKKNGWKVVWTIHSMNEIIAFTGYEQALREWQKTVAES